MNFLRSDRRTSLQTKKEYDENKIKSSRDYCGRTDPHIIEMHGRESENRELDNEVPSLLRSPKKNHPKSKYKIKK